MSDRSPNVLFLLTDDQRFDAIAAVGDPEIHTPNLDALAEGGTSFTQAQIMGGTSPAVCMPSRAMLHSGRTLFRLAGQGGEIPREHPTLGETLKSAGYQCFGTGKWHNGRDAFARSFEDGDHIFFGGMADHWNVPAYRYDPTGKYDNTLPRCTDPMGSKAVEQRPADHIVAGKHSTELVTDATLAFLGRHDPSRPFFAYVSFLAPHDPRTMPAEHRNRYDAERLPLPSNFMGAHPFDNGELHIRDEMLEGFPRTPEAIREHIADYYAMVSHIDAEVGRMLSALDEAGLRESTLIVLGGDNGLAVGQHGLMGKQNLYDHSVRVPLIFNGPGVPAGRRSEALVYLHDAYPTICEMAGVSIPASVEGVSLAPLFGEGGAAPRHYAHAAYMDKQRSVRDDRYKLIEYAVEGRRRTQLFDLLADPAELSSLAEDPAHADVVQRLRGELERWRSELGDTREAGERFWATYDGG